MEKEDLIKKMENIDVPFIEMSSHKTRLKAALLDSDCFKERKHSFWFGKFAVIGLSGAFVLLIFLGAEEIFFKAFEEKMALNSGQNSKSSLNYLQTPKITSNNSTPAMSNNFIPKTTALPETTTSPITGNKIAGWSTYQNNGFGYEIKLPNNWELEAIRTRDGIGGAGDNSYLDEKWPVDPTPVFEVTPENEHNLVWLVKDENGDIKLKISITFKTKTGNISLEEFSNSLLTPKDKIISLASIKTKLGINEVVKQDLQISDPVYSGTRYFISNTEYFCTIETVGNADPALTDQIISTFVPSK
jgi:hypothetical protein